MRVRAAEPYRDWLRIEFFSFYCYILGASIFIMRHQCKEWIWQSHETDIKKQITDFLFYRMQTLIWYCFNIVGVFMPPYIVGVVLLIKV